LEGIASYRSLGKEVEQGLVDFVGVGPSDVVWSALGLDEPDVLMRPGRRRPVASMGRMRSALPCTSSMGTLIFGRSAPRPQRLLADGHLWFDNRELRP
jgi:hypothetical protein